MGSRASSQKKPADTEKITEFTEKLLKIGNSTR
jgi:hypothetical protein